MPSRAAALGARSCRRPPCPAGAYQPASSPPCLGSDDTGRAQPHNWFGWNLDPSDHFTILWITVLLLLIQTVLNITGAKAMRHVDPGRWQPAGVLLRPRSGAAQVVVDLPSTRASARR